MPGFDPGQWLAGSRPASFYRVRFRPSLRRRNRVANQGLWTAEPGSSAEYARAYRTPTGDGRPGTGNAEAISRTSARMPPSAAWSSKQS